MRLQVNVDGYDLFNEELQGPADENRGLAWDLAFWLQRAARHIKGFKVPRELASMTVTFTSSDR